MMREPGGFFGHGGGFGPGPAQWHGHGPHGHGPHGPGHGAEDPAGGHGHGPGPHDLLRRLAHGFAAGGPHGFPPGGPPPGGRPGEGFPGFPGFPGFGGGRSFGGPPPWVRGGRGRGPWGHGPRAKKGDVRAAILSLLAEEPRNGYQIIQEINQRSGGAWKPSPGAVYPALQQLADEGLVYSEEGGGGRKTFRLTDEGRTYVEEHVEELNAPWQAMSADVHDDVRGLFEEAAKTGAALMQVARNGSEAQILQARRLLAETRRRLYLILAEDDDEEGGDAGTDAGDADGDTGTPGTAGDDKAGS